MVGTILFIFTNSVTRFLLCSTRVVIYNILTWNQKKTFVIIHCNQSLFFIIISNLPHRKEMISYLPTSSEKSNNAASSRICCRINSFLSWASRLFSAFMCSDTLETIDNVSHHMARYHGNSNNVGYHGTVDKVCRYIIVHNVGNKYKLSCHRNSGWSSLTNRGTSVRMYPYITIRETWQRWITYIFIRRYAYG